MCARWPYAGRALIPWMKSLRPQGKRRKTLSRPDQQRKQRTRGSNYFGKIFWDRLTQTVKCREMTLKSNRPLDLVTFLRCVVPKRFLKSHSPGDSGGLVHVLSTQCWRLDINCENQIYSIILWSFNNGHFRSNHIIRNRLCEPISHYSSSQNQLYRLTKWYFF